jgi:cell shape-determining protein MreC
VLLGGAIILPVALPLQAQMDKIAKIVQPIQKQLKSMEKQTDLIKQMQGQLRQLQNQVSQVQKENQKTRTLLLSKKNNKTSSTKNKNIKRKGTRRTR